jgi:UDP-N-acetylmuramoyl-tripeptide--D-alanyl-D-alanine ligase
VPLRGESFDGHRFIPEVLARGATAFFYEPGRFQPDASQASHAIAVESTLAAYQAVARAWRLSLPVKVIGLTGSAGKTTTKEMLAFVLAQCGDSIATVGSLNNEVGVPQTLLRLRPTTRYAALELAARHCGDIRLLTEIACPDTALCLNVGTAHLGEFGGEENLLNTKLEIFRHAPEGAALIPNFDDPRILAPARALSNHRVLSFGRGIGADVQIVSHDWLSETGGMRVSLQALGQPLTVELKHAHEAYPINVAAVVAGALGTGISREAIMAGLAAFEPPAGRFRVLRGEHLTLVDDAYNANPDSMRIGIQSLTRLFPGRRHVLVLGDMLELGADSDRLHREVGSAAADLHPAFLITVGQQGALIHEAAIQRGMNAANTKHFRTTKELQEHHLSWASLGDVIFLKASHGIGLQGLVSTILSDATTGGTR